MNSHTHFSRWISTSLLATVALALAVPAFADNGRRRYKGAQNHSSAQRVVIQQRSSSAGPVLAGLIGGFILGAAVTSNARPVMVHERPYRRSSDEYRYYDPYGDDWYDSLGDCDFRNGGPRIVYVIDVRSGQHVRSLRYRDGRWNRYEDERSGGYYRDDDRSCERSYNYRDEGDDD